MKRFALVFAVLVGCGDDSVGKLPDGGHAVDAPHVAPDAPHTGSGSDSAELADATPRDHKLEILVAGLSAVVVVGPLGAMRRRRA